MSRSLTSEFQRFSRDRCSDIAASPPAARSDHGTAGWDAHLTFEPVCNLARRPDAAAGRRRDWKGRLLNAQPAAAEIATAVRRTRVYLATGHRNHDTSENAPTNLAAWCQRCHILHDGPEHRRRRHANRQRRQASGTCSLAPTGDPRALGDGKSGASRFVGGGSNFCVYVKGEKRYDGNRKPWGSSPWLRLDDLGQIRSARVGGRTAIRLAFSLRSASALPGTQSHLITSLRARWRSAPWPRPAAVPQDDEGPRPPRTPGSAPRALGIWQ